MRRASAVLCLVALLLVPAVQAAPWLQPRGDAAATGFQPDEGPEWKDVALSVMFPDGMAARDSPPLILEDRILLTGTPVSATSDGYDRDGPGQVLSVDLSTGQLSTVGEIPAEETSCCLNGGWIATDGDTVYRTGNRSVHAIPVSADGNEWTWSFEPRTRPSATEYCNWIVPSEDHVTVACHEFWEEEETSLEGEQVSVLARLDKATGEAEWTWERPPPPDSASSQRSSTRSIPVGLAVSGPVVLVQTIEVVGDDAPLETSIGGAAAGAGRAEFAVWALEADTGEQTWNWSSEPIHDTGSFPGPLESMNQEPALLTGNPATSDQAVYVKANGVHKLALGSGERLWSEAIGEEDIDPGLGGVAGIGLADGEVFATSAQTVYRMDTEEPDEGWSTSISLSSGTGFDESPVVTPERVYTAAETSGSEDEQSGSLYAIDRDDGEILWKKDAGDVWGLSVGEGVLAYTNITFTEQHATGRLAVLGSTEASPEPRAEVSSAYPSPGETVEVDLSDSTAGVQGPVTRYKAIWGDGNATGWQDDAVLEHAYDEAGEVEARFVVGNEAGQTASTTQIFNVGGSEPNLLSQAFDPENQDMTFGILGVLLAVGGGAIGVGRRYRKRNRLQEELQAVEQLFEETRERPTECEAQLTERKAHARGLMTDGYLTEEQFQVVENRIEELKRELRVTAVEEEFAFLPYSLVTSLQEILEDRRVTEMEKEGFLAALEEDDTLHPDQKAAVRQRIEDWFRRDSGNTTG